ncbi:MAG: pyridoxamine 5'-phosphate oxidase family protein [Acidimicrobiales bacterium]
MSKPVDLGALRAEVEARGPAAYLITIGPDRPHVVSALLTWSDEHLVAEAGRTTERNLAADPAVTLLWAARPGEDYCLLVDGTGQVFDGRVAVQPHKAMQHRQAGDDAGPRCLPIA